MIKCSLENQDKLFGNRLRMVLPTRRMTITKRITKNLGTFDWSLIGERLVNVSLWRIKNSAAFDDFSQWIRPIAKCQRHLPPICSARLSLFASDLSTTYGSILKKFVRHFVM